MKDAFSGRLGKVLEKVKKFMRSKWGEFAVLAALSGLALFFTVIFMSVKFTDFLCIGVERGNYSFWTAKIIYIGVSSSDAWFIKPFSVYFIAVFLICVATYAAAAAVMLIKKKKTVFFIAASLNVLLCVICLVMGTAFNIMRGGAVACCVISLIFAAVLLAYLVLRRRLEKAEAADGEEQTPGEISKPDKLLPPGKCSKLKIVLLIDECVSLLILLSLFFVPFYSAGENPVITYSLSDALSSAQAPAYVSVAFVAAFIAFFVEILCFSSTLIDYFKNYNSIAERSKRFVVSVAGIALAFFVLSFSFTFFDRISGGGTGFAVTAGFIPLILILAVLLVHSFICGKMPSAGGTYAGSAARRPLKAEPLFAVAAMTAVTLVSLILKVVSINIEVKGGYRDTVSLSGYELLKDYPSFGAGFQLMAFVEFAVILSACLLLAFTVIGFISKDNSYYKTVKISAVANFLFVLCIGLFGVYFKIGKQINLENFEKILEFYNLEFPKDIVYDVSSQTIYMLAASFAVLAYMILRGMFRLGAGYAEGEYPCSIPADGMPQPVQTSAPAEEKRFSEPAVYANFDACPAFTELDGRQAYFRSRLAERRKQLFENATLPSLVRFVVDYARECRLHLSYSAEDIATFVAGLGASRLAILQGMSGTGKTSLPKVFTEAVMGECDIVEVESSWRDKNELLGYYNEFSKCFTPKKFTQCLYKARLNPSVITFIVLDEMNLSRIEYYFSDFLSLMENEEDKREIKLLNVKLCRTENGANIQYAGLVGGHTVKIPENVWFIGTANRDESTFEISDKVYDRAQTMNFNKRAPKIHSFGSPLEQRFVAYETLVNLFETARNSYEFEAEYNVLVQKTEKLLQKYNISFGNRILRQMEDFVKIYCACFGDKAAVEKDAVERILLSKVVSKLESKVVENKELLAAEFDKLGLKSCGEFVRKLNED